MLGKIIFRLSLAYLIGGSFVVAFLAAPLVFQLAPDRNTAGAIAGAIINRYAWTAAAATGIALISSRIFIRMPDYSKRSVRWLGIVLLTSLAIQLVSYVVLRPMMNELIVQIGDFELTAKDHPLRQQFGLLHGLSSVLFLIASALGIGALVIESMANQNGSMKE